ncbi:ChaB family protein [Desmospora profundinema]|uniref:ChaB family protein n=1 Tax=Desmospora profundinema TaxID=1571184 RepID=UPI00286A9FA6|nr:ChaB family protein [Desmospora profundinema]
MSRLAMDVEEIPLHDLVTEHLSERAKEIYSSSFHMVWIHTQGERVERQKIAHQVAWDRLKQEYTQPVRSPIQVDPGSFELKKK